MKRVGVREFRDHATQYLGAGELLTIERYGEPIGYYIPVGPGTRQPQTHGFERLEQVIEQVLAQTGFTEEQLAQFFDMSQPLPEEWEAPASESDAASHAPHR